MDLIQRRRFVPAWALSVLVLVVALLVGAVGESVLQPHLAGAVSFVESQIAKVAGSLTWPIADSLRAPGVAGGAQAKADARPSSAVPAAASSGSVARPFLGISYEQLSPQSVSSSGSSATQGALVDTVEANSPADKAGLQAGDVITAIDQTQLDAEHSLAGVLLNHKAGDTIDITVTRSQESMTLTATLAQRPANGP